MSFSEPPAQDVKAEGSSPGEGANPSDDRAARTRGRISEEDEASLGIVALRDFALIVGLLSLFAAAEAWARVTGLAFASILSVADGLLVGAAVAAICHEWGHLAGARLAGGHAPLKPMEPFFPLFDFDYEHNDARAFDWMSIGGNAGDIGVVLLFLVALPVASVGTTALTAGAIGFAVFAGAIEFPVIQKARAGLSGLEALATIPRDFFRRYLRWGLAAAGVSLVLL